MVYESIYGNTHSIAEAIAEGLQGSVDAEVIPAAQIQGRASKASHWWSPAARPTATG